MNSINDQLLWTATITPFDSEGHVDYDDLEILANRQNEAGNGFLILGSTGEGLALTLEEKKEIVRYVSGHHLSVPVMVGIGGFNLEEQIKWIHFCNEFAIDAYLIVTPLYAKPGPEGQAHWFKTLMDHAERPCMIYNVPSRTGVALHPKALKKVENHPNLLGVKEASGQIEKFAEFRRTCPNVDFYSGDDGLMPYFAMAGCKGLVSVIANVWPKATRRYVEYSLQGRGNELFPLWKQASEALFVASNPIPAKVLLQHKGVIKTSVLRPPLTPDDLASKEPLIAADAAVEDWFGHEEPAEHQREFVGRNL